MGFLSSESVKAMGFLSVGENVKISEKASFYNCAKITIANNVRIDDFCVISAGAGGIEIGSFVHLAVGCTLIGQAKISVGDFSGISSRTAVYSSNDDYSGEYLTGPTIDEEFRKVDSRDVRIGRHAIIGSGCVILPGVTIGDGVAVGALSLVSRDCADFSVYIGAPARKVKARKMDLLEKEKEFLDKRSRAKPGG